MEGHLEPSRRAQEAGARAAELAERLMKLAANEAPSVEDARRAHEAAALAVRRGAAAHERAAIAHRRAASAHRQAADVAEAAGNASRAAEHRAAALVDEVAGRGEDAAARADWDRRLASPATVPGPPRPETVRERGDGRSSVSPISSPPGGRAVQEAHLPATVPVLPALDIAACYRSGVDADASGGDWFDVVVRGDGTTVLVAGDVVGGGASAAAAMGQLRAVCHDRLAAGTDLTSTLADIDRFARRVPGARHATVCVVVLDPRTGRGSYCTAGHPPPLVLVAGQATFLAPTGAGPLATSGDFPVRPLDLAHGGVVLLYTDGLLERPGSTVASRTVELAQAVGDAEDAAGGTGATSLACDLVLRRMMGGVRHHDDVVLLAARRRDAPTPLRLTLAARSPMVKQARDRVVAWLDALGEIRASAHLSVVHAVSELLSNVVEHAYAHRGEPGEMTLELRLAETGELTARVTDSGRWQGSRGEPAASSGGRGLLLARNLLDRLDVTSDGNGTTATGTLLLTRPVSMSAPADLGAGSPEDPPFALVEEPGRLVVFGAVLLDASGPLERRLRLLTRGGTVPVTIDLSGVTHLGSAGVTVLHDLVTRDGVEVTLLAPLGSVAQHVLDLVRLPYRSEP
jgi:serine phosphatase RsbU (regulator of sigma subunit)/anti-sigma regulatory factor (Ser/Thr protein kinase)/ABC-type transporter Mla MlaB component